MNMRRITLIALVASLAAGSVLQAKRVEVSIEGLKFKPDNVKVEAGDTVIWTNNDDRDHAIKAADGSFESGRLRSGKRYERKFDRPGSFDYGDDLHPRMRGTVTVSKEN